MDCYKLSFLTRKALEVGFKSQLEKNGSKETELGVYNLRNWDEIRSWTQEINQKAKE